MSFSFDSESIFEYYDDGQLKSVNNRLISFNTNLARTMTSKERNEQALIIWNTLLEAELKALLNNETESQKAQSIRLLLPRLKRTKKWAYSSLKRIAESGCISTYVDALCTEMRKDYNDLISN